MSLYSFNLPHPGPVFQLFSLRITSVHKSLPKVDSIIKEEQSRRQPNDDNLDSICLILFLNISNINVDCGG